MSDRILGAVAILVAAAMAVASWGYAAPVEYEPVGPRAFPLLLAALMALCGAWLVLRSAAGEGPFFMHAGNGPRVALCAAAVVVYAILFQLLGFILATVLMALPVGRLFGGSWKQCTLTGIVLGVALYILFDKLLDVVLPVGVLKPVFAQIGL
ncbi:tripartite tricarboxylate transporter TctB family protein [Noviherbaspirillum massiliense]|uniref:tripartite tricarboxylate transporter TctB family protein n=1 Tax=Noviherbaspirillum massiliense TaxID=1465823 RepID=UPI0003681656|nr:tripartite tricarboxylate transporter TctB family protein [Noviherbaspirillum massiliense]